MRVKVPHSYMVTTLGFSVKWPRRTHIFSIYALVSVLTIARHGDFDELFIKI